MKPIKKPDQQKPTLTGCARLHQLLSQAPKATREDDNTGIGWIVGSAGMNFFIGDLTARTFDESTHQLVRAMAACQLGLFADPNNLNRYIPPGDLENGVDNVTNETYSFSKGSSHE